MSHSRAAARIWDGSLELGKVCPVLFQASFHAYKQPSPAPAEWLAEQECRERSDGFMSLLLSCGWGSLTARSQQLLPAGHGVLPLEMKNCPLPPWAAQGAQLTVQDGLGDPSVSLRIFHDPVTIHYFIKLLPYCFFWCCSSFIHSWARLSDFCFFYIRF